MDPVLTFKSAVQRDDPTYLVDFIFEATWPGRAGPSRAYGSDVYGAFAYGDPKDLTVDAVDYSIDDGATWQAATAQPFDRKHSATDPLENVSVIATEFDFVWDTFRDLPEGDFEARLRITVTGSSTTLTTTPFSVTTIVPPLDEDRLASSLEKRRLSERVDDFLGAGPIAPLRRGSSDFMTGRGRELVKSAIWQILNTRGATERWGGEIPWEPGFGALFWTLRHAPADEITEELAHSYAEDALAWEPRVVVESVKTEFFSKSGGNGKNRRALRVEVGYSIISENAPANQVILPEVETVEVEIA